MNGWGGARVAVNVDRRRRPLTAESFWARVDQSGGPDACWPWKGKRTPSRGGYGRLYETGVGRARRELAAHRVALAFALGRPLQEGMEACHHCDNPPCCNPGPGHLYEGTKADNMRDMVERGRSLAGERHRRRTLTADEVRAIRAQAGTRPRKDLAAEFGVSGSAITLILNGTNWRSVA